MQQFFLKRVAQLPKDVVVVGMIGFFGSVVISCGINDRSPEGAAKLFIAAVDAGDSAGIVALLASPVKARLGELAEEANRKAKGLKTFTPADMLATRMERPIHRLAKITLVEENDHSASVELSNASEDYRETLHLVRENARWRINFP